MHQGDCHGLCQTNVASHKGFYLQVGSVLLDQLQAQRAILLERFHIDVRLLGIADSRRMLLSNQGTLKPF